MTTPEFRLTAGLVLVLTNIAVSAMTATTHPFVAFVACPIGAFIGGFMAWTATDRMARR